MSGYRMSMVRRGIAVLVMVVVVTFGGGGSLTAVGPCWSPPVTGVVTDPFRQPPCTWCPGNRGIEYAVVPNSAVRAVAAGTVTFSGAIAGERYVVVELASGWKLTYGRIASTSLSAGDVVVSGSIVARTADHFFFGLRIDDGYADPAPFLGVEGGRRRLIPVDGRPARPAPPPRLSCEHRP